MILEVAIFAVKPDAIAAFEAAYQKASPLIGRAAGNLGHEMRRCLETKGRYILTVKWNRIEDHLEGFRNSADIQEWRRLLGPHQVQPALVEHYESL